MLHPVIGQQLWFWPKGTSQARGHQPLPAIVSRVESPDLVNIAAWHADGSPILNPPRDVPLIQLGSKIPDEGPYCLVPIPETVP